MCERRALPVHGPQQNRNDASLLCLVAFKGALHLDAIAVVGGQEVRAHQQENHGGPLQVSIYGLRPIGSGKNLTIMPSCDQPLSLQEAQVLFQFGAQRLVLVSVRIEHLDGRIWHQCASSAAYAILYAGVYSLTQV